MVFLRNNLTFNKKAQKDAMVPWRHWFSLIYFELGSNVNKGIKRPPKKTVNRISMNDAALISQQPDNPEKP